jgi:hypothetical protein
MYFCLGGLGGPSPRPRGGRIAGTARHGQLFEEHEAQEHTRHFVEASEPLLEATNACPFTLMAEGFRSPRPAAHTNG